ncbi:MAG: hypothetical protein CVT59_06185 [Actinobacteria bacterium HGW-Actinobacteria-1]|jgi:hypothetical protein|nr:MAG: hypothetical protein CVT59_06185 [Actinobacteria bacterium HGW-Actinobacteria-1]
MRAADDRIRILGSHFATTIVLLSLILGSAFTAACTPSSAGSAEGPGFLDTQAELITTLGEPTAFQIAYAPADDADADGATSLRRTEVWYYLEHEQQISFVDGVAVAVQGWEFMPEVPTDYPTLSPADFHIDMTLADVESILGEPAEEVIIDPALAEEDDTHVYVTESAIFTIERGALTYLQTIGVER